ncbi:uncharacterized protein JCM15063_003795 [Sporobolomyces koalae]|uniref:uncharacterized protein n=1 Tax=Sporobolomyces koalae TaxID=500713 RepID=UPI00317B3FC7
MPRSPSPAASSHSHSSKRRKYADAEASPSSSSGRRDRHRDREDDYDYDRRASRSNRDYDRDRERDRDRDSHRDRDYDRRRDYDDRDRHRSSRSSRAHDERDSRRDRGDDDRYSGSSSRRRREYDDDRERARDRDDRHTSSKRDYYREDDSHSRRTDRRRTRSPSPTRTTRHDSVPQSATPTDGHATPRSDSAASLPVPTATADPAAAAEEEKKRLKREKLEAWKKKKAEEAAGSTPKVATPLVGSPLRAGSSASTAAAPAPASSISHKIEPAAGLPARPAPPISAALPAKPVSSATSLTSAPSKAKAASALGASPTDATAAAAAAAAAIASRLGTTSFSPFNNKNAAFQKTHTLPAGAGLPNKPTFSFGAGVKNQLARGGMKMGGEDDDAGSKKIGMIKFEDEDLTQSTVGQGDEDEEEDEEDLEGGASYAGAAEAREKRMREIQQTEGSSVKMEVDEAQESGDVKMEDAPDAQAETTKEEPEEDEEEDELDAFMSQVNKEVKNVEKEDKRKLNGGKKVKEETVMKNGEEEGGEDEEVEEEHTGMTAKDILALAAKNVKKGRELKAPDHKNIDYLPFRKAFYSAPPEVEELTPEQVDLLRLEMDDIKIRGADPPKPATKWSYFGLPAACIDVIKGLEYVAPTSIQAQAIPAIMSGRDIIGVAKTGSGKTMAFILPMFRHIKDQPPLRPMDGPVAMIMTPTRELATQIYKECKPFLKALGLRASCAYGGMPLKDNIADMKRGSEVIVCTPGRMIELLTTNSGRLINLQRVTYLVLDEADRMFDMGFEPQVMKIIGQIRPDRQTVLFSATFPRQMEALARKVLRRPLEITVGGRSVVADTITQVVEVRPEDSKFNRMLELLGKLFNDEEDARALIFVERQESADKLFVELKNKNYTCMPLHGGREQVDRDQTIVDFKNGSCPIVIATSVAARGLDVKQLKMVIQYDVPNHMEDYVHRAGRTGRAGNTGTCVTFITPEQEKYSYDIFKALQASNAEVPAELKAMAEAFAEKVKAGNAKAAGSGFGGKGLEKLDDERAAASRAERAAYGESGGPAGEKKAGEEDAEAGEEGETSTAQTVADLEIEIMRGPAPDLQKGKALPTGGGVTNNAAKEADEAAKKAEQEALAAGKSAATAAAESVRAKFNAMLKSRRQPQAEPDNSTEAARRRDPDATDYHAIVWINDYPQKARWKVTNKETMVHFVESTGASITNKGIFYEPGKEPGPNDLPKLHLLIESNEEFRVKHAIAEIKQALIEGATMALEAEQRQPLGGGGAAAGRYSVV